jgi:hypothetical protein
MMNHETFDARHSTKERARSLDDLARMTCRELRALYDDGTVPALDALDGDLVGRMLAVRSLDRGAPFRFLATVARSARFPWGGKSFASKSATRGTGINRVQLGGRHRLFPFETHVDASVLDDKPCVVLDYDLADNPGAIRAIHDEVREVAPKIFLGPACVKRAGKKPLVALWFALDAR